MKRYKCTKQEPWNKEKHGNFAYHPDAKEIGEQEDNWPLGDIVTYKCPNCGVVFTKELPQ